MTFNLRPISNLENIPVLDLESGAVLGRVLGWAFNLHQQKLIAFVVNHGGLLQPPQIIVPTDIVEYGPKMILVPNRQVIIHPQEVVGLPELLKIKSNPIGLIATTEEGRVLGKIDNIDIDTIGSQIQRYHIRPSLIANITQPDLLLSADYFVRLNKNRLVFRVGAQTVVQPETNQTKTEIA